MHDSLTIRGLCRRLEDSIIPSRCIAYINPKLYRHHYALPFFIAAILAFRSSLRLAISASFSSLLIPARLLAVAARAADVPADDAEGAGDAAKERGTGSAALVVAAGVDAGAAAGAGETAGEGLLVEAMAGASVGTALDGEAEAVGLGTAGLALPLALDPDDGGLI
jgi:hypothetical protein